MNIIHKKCRSVNSFEITAGAFNCLFFQFRRLNIAAVDVHLRIVPLVGGVSNPDFLQYSLKSGLETPPTMLMWQLELIY